MEDKESKSIDLAFPSCMSKSSTRFHSSIIQVPSVAAQIVAIRIPLPPHQNENQLLPWKYITRTLEHIENGLLRTSKGLYLQQQRS